MHATKLPYSLEEKSKRIFAIMAVATGNLVEWFDFYIYAFCAIYFTPVFFPKFEPTVKLLTTVGVFAAVFLSTPPPDISPSISFH